MDLVCWEEQLDDGCSECVGFKFIFISWWDADWDDQRKQTGDCWENTASPASCLTPLRLSLAESD